MKETTVPEEVQQQAPATREESRTLVPPVDIFETPEALVVIADLPGVSKEGVEVRVENDVLTVKGQAQISEKGDPIRREFELRDYFRQFQLGEQINQEKITADMKGGVLTVNLPKTENVKPKRIDVNVSK
ncbi:MAG TPA: Hsp20/alpha crystallin family protein [Candidatus Hydrogenedentes bacterium]|nr:Hsp20/alpha crystallin family protein [Candidatus Hydrogenedentota bacterium]